MVAEHTLRSAAFDKAAHELDHPGTIGPAIAEIACEDEAPTLGVLTVRVVAEPLEQGVQDTELAMDVADQVERSIEER